MGPAAGAELVSLRWMNLARLRLMSRLRTPRTQGRHRVEEPPVLVRAIPPRVDPVAPRGEERPVKRAPRAVAGAEAAPAAVEPAVEPAVAVGVAVAEDRSP